jgi:hypothetical protein
MSQFFSMGLFVVNNGDFPNCEEAQQLRCGICFPHVVLEFLIGKKTKGKKGIILHTTPSLGWLL